MSLREVATNTQDHPDANIVATGETTTTCTAAVAGILGDHPQDRTLTRAIHIRLRTASHHRPFRLRTLIRHTGEAAIPPSQATEAIKGKSGQDGIFFFSPLTTMSSSSALRHTPTLLNHHHIMRMDTLLHLPAPTTNSLHRHTTLLLRQLNNRIPLNRPIHPDQHRGMDRMAPLSDLLVHHRGPQEDGAAISRTCLGPHQLAVEVANW